MMRGLRHDIGSWSRLGGLGRVVLAALAAVVGVLMWTGLAGGTQPYATYESTVAADGPVAQYRFDDATGSSTLADSAGSYTATNSGIVLGGEGPFGGSKSGAFGGSAFASLPSNPLAGASAFSAEGWVDWTGGASYKQPVFDFGSSPTNYMYLTPASALTSHTMLFEIHTTAGTVFQVTAPTLKSKAWEYVAVTETSSGTLTLYLNGVQVGQTTGATIMPSSLGSTPDDYLGKSLISSEPSFNGSMSNVAFYNKALTAEQIKANYNAAKFPVNTVLPTVSGTPEDGQTLTAAAGTWTGLTPITYTYQWTLCEPSGAGCANIASATKTTFKATSEDVGRTLRIAVTASNSAGSSSASSNQTATVASLPPANTKLPALSGTAKDGQVLTVSTGTWTGTPPLSYTYQWEACNSSGAECAGIAGATASTYRVISSEIGGTLRAVVTASNAGGSASATSAVSAVIAAGLPVNTALPEVSGTAMEGQTLSASTGTWAGTAPFTYTYQWEKCNSAGESCANLTGATKATYVLSSSNLGSTLRVIVTAKNASGSAKATSSATAVVVAKAPANTALPAISGTAQDGQTLTASTGSWTGITPLSYAYQWQRCNSSGEGCSNITGGTGSSYVLGHGDVGSTLRVVVTAKNTAGSSSASSTATAVVTALAPSNTTVPAITGTATDGQTLTASTGTWAGTPPLTYSYQWQSCNTSGEACSNISGATSSTYVLGHSDVGTTLRVTVTASNTAGSASSTSEATGTVAALAPSNTAAPAITGTAQDGQTLTASTGTWSGTPTISYSYQYQSCNSAGEGCANISGATSSTYVVGHGDVGTTLRVVVTATNSAGPASSTSGATAVVTALAPSNTAPPAISGEAKQGQTLSTSTGEWVGTPSLTYTYQWESCDSLGEGCLAISGATASSHALGAGEVGDTLRVVVTATNVAGSASASSAATAVVTGSSGCTDTWTGEVGDDSWQTAGNWSTGNVPSSSDRACIPSEATVDVAGGANAVGSIAGEGGLAITGGSLELTDASTTSTVASLTLSNATLTGAGSLDVSGAFSLGPYSTMSGSGETVVGRGVSGEIYASSGCEEMRLAGGRTLVNEGTLTFGWGTLFLSEGARLQNEGVFVDDTESSCYGPQIQSESGSGAAPSVLNTGTFEKTGGGGTSTVAVNFSNQGSVEAKNGTLEFSDGGIPEETANGSWAVQSGASIVLSGGTFWIAEAVNLSAVTVDGATVVRVGSGPPASSSAPVVSGQPFDGGTLSASTGTWTGSRPISYSYQWQRCNASGGECANIAGATGKEYTLTNSDVGATVLSVVTAQNSFGPASAASSATAVVAVPPAPSNTAPPEVSGVAQVEQPLSVSTGSWSSPVPVSYSYQWERCDLLGGECTAISGATASTYNPVVADLGRTLTVQVTATNPGGSSSAISQATSEVLTAVPVNTLAPALSSNSPEEGVSDSASIGTWAGESLVYSYQWESCNEKGEECAEIEGAVEETYIPGPGDVGNTLRVLVTASNEGGVVPVTSETSAPVRSSVTFPLNLTPPEIAGNAQQGQTLSAQPGTWTGTPPLTYSYQWESCNTTGEDCADVLGATESTYRLASGDVGSTLRVVVTASNGDGHASHVSPASAVVEGLSSSEAACTDVWIGSSGGSWEEGANWSTGNMPSASDVACIGPGSSVVYAVGGGQVGVLHDEGELTMYSGSLEIVDTSETSTISTLNMIYDNPRITGPGSLYVSHHLEWTVGEMLGTGQTVIGPAATALLEPSPYVGVLKERKLVNEGTLTFPAGRLTMLDGALLENRGTFKDNSEACGSCGGTSGELFASSEGAAPKILNIGAFEKTQGTGTTRVAVNFTNDGTVSASSGTLRFSDGGVPEQSATGTWSVENGGSIVLAGGTFPIGETVGLQVVHVEEGATVERAAAPVSVLVPGISGSTRAGQTLTASGGSWSGSEPISLAYQWERCNASGAECGSITGATGQSYVLASGDAGATVRVMVTASNSYGQALAASSTSAVIEQAPAPSNTALPVISGTTQADHTLTASTGEWSAIAPVSYAYQWDSCDTGGGECAPVENATGPKYELSEGDIGSTLRVIVTTTDPGGTTSETSQASAVIGAEPPSELEAPSVSGTPDVHQVLYADAGVWTGTETQLSYQWESCSESGSECAPIEGATGTEYDLTEGDLSTTLRVRVGAYSALDSVSDLSPVTAAIDATGALAATQAPTISGTPQAGQALTAQRGAWSGGVGVIGYAYQWQRCDSVGAGCEDIPGATTSSYVPTAADVDHRLQVLLTASDEASHSVAKASNSTQPVAATQAPVIEQPPVISEPALKGQTLTAGTGVFSGESPISYSYQWERCAAPAACEAIEGATHSYYTLTESDVGSTVLVLVSATNPDGNTTAVSQPTATVGPEPLLELSAPSISGAVQTGSTLSADPGIWSGEGPVTYAYQWKSCNAAGEDCAPIEGATEPTYVVLSGDLGSTLRIEVTATSPLGSKSATSTHTPAAPGGEVSVEESQATIEHTDPAILAPATTAMLEGESIAPALTDTGEELTSQNTLTNSTVSKETAGELSINTPAGELSLTPVESQPTAATPPTIVNGAAALFANTWPATDTIIRPESLGATAILQLRSAEAPRSFSWQARLGPDQELKQLSDGSVAVVEASEETTEPSGEQEESETGELPNSGEGPAETSKEKEETEKEEAEPETEEEVPLETLPASPTSHTEPSETGTGQPEPQQTTTAYETAESAIASAEDQTGKTTLMVISPPKVTDAEGHSVSSTLSFTNDTLTMRVNPGSGAGYPLLLDATVSATSDKKSAAKGHSIRYGLSDPRPELAGHIDEHFNEKGEKVSGFDPNLKNGPLHVNTMRLIVPYDVVASSTAYAKKEKKRLNEWLKKIGDRRGHPQPLITIGKDASVDPCGEGENPACSKRPSVEAYRIAVERLMKDYIAGNRKFGYPPVELWGAWNEPDLPENPLRYKHETKAAQFWEVSQAILAKITKKHRCPHCAMLAGEFSFFSGDTGYEKHYTSVYRNAILRYLHESRHCPKYYWCALPAAWGFHDYHDVVERDKSIAEEFTTFTHNRLGKPRVFMSEAGVELQNGQTPVLVNQGDSKVELAGDSGLEAQAAEDFRNLHEHLPRIDREYYYMYTSPTKPEQEAHVFDSALLEVENGQVHERPAYCVLAYDKHLCPPIIERIEQRTEVGGGLKICTSVPPAVEIAAHVNPEGAKSLSFHFEYGAAGSYGKSTASQTMPVRNSAQSVEIHGNVSLAGAPLNEHLCPIQHYRLVVSSGQATRHSAEELVEWGVII